MNGVAGLAGRHAGQERADGPTCADCASCTEPDEFRWKNPERMGYCKFLGEFVGLGDSVVENELECFGR